MIVLGFIDSKPSAVSIVADGRIVSAIPEERLCRKKLAGGMPRQAVAMAMSVAGVSPSEIDCVAVAHDHMPFEPDPVAYDGWFRDGDGAKAQWFERLSSILAPIVGSSPISWRAHHQLKRLMFRDRRWRLPALLRDAYGIVAPVRFYDHHYCHATSAYYTSNFDEALVITLDGGGDGRSGSAYIGTNGRLRQLTGVSSFNSLGNFYSYITALCGFKAEKHEGKVTGLAALGQPIYADILRQFIRYE